MHYCYYFVATCLEDYDYCSAKTNPQGSKTYLKIGGGLQAVKRRRRAREGGEKKDEGE